MAEFTRTAEDRLAEPNIFQLHGKIETCKKYQYLCGVACALSVLQPLITGSFKLTLIGLPIAIGTTVVVLVNKREAQRKFDEGVVAQASPLIIPEPEPEA